MNSRQLPRTWVVSLAEWKLFERFLKIRVSLLFLCIWENTMFLFSSYRNVLNHCSPGAWGKLSLWCFFYFVPCEYFAHHEYFELLTTTLNKYIWHFSKMSWAVYHGNICLFWSVILGFWSNFKYTICNTNISVLMKTKNTVNISLS